MSDNLTKIKEVNEGLANNAVVTDLSKALDEVQTLRGFYSSEHGKAIIDALKNRAKDLFLDLLNNYQDIPHTELVAKLSSLREIYLITVRLKTIKEEEDVLQSELDNYIKELL